MTPIEIIKMIKELGLAGGVMWLCIWVVQYVAKSITKALEKLTERIEISTNKTREEHKELKEESRMRSDEHKEFTLQQKEITSALGRINGFK